MARPTSRLRVENVPSDRRERLLVLLVGYALVLTLLGAAQCAGSLP
jgi:hypothetical protein